MNMSEKYPDSTLDARFKSIEDKLDEHFEATTKVLGDIKEQTTKTNGRVNNLEGSRQYQVGGLTVLSILVVPALGFLAYMVIETSNHIAAIDATITQLETHP